MFLFTNGKRVVVVFPTSVGDPDVFIRKHCHTAYGHAFEVLPPSDPAYHQAYKQIDKDVLRIDRDHAQIVFGKPVGKFQMTAAWVRIVDVSRFLLN